MVNSTGSSSEINITKCSSGGGGGARDSGNQKHDDECDIIGRLIGDYGRWQFIMTLLLALFQVPNTFHIYSPTFQVSEEGTKETFFVASRAPSKFSFFLFFCRLQTETFGANDHHSWQMPR